MAHIGPLGRYQQVAQTRLREQYHLPPSLRSDGILKPQMAECTLVTVDAGTGPAGDHVCRIPNIFRDGIAFA
jgi:hypothetical protein